MSDYRGKAMDSTSIAPPPITESRNHSRLLITAGILVGMGLAGFFDGIVLHQVLQWHHVLSSVRPGDNLTNLEINTFWDGIFHIGAYILTISGLILLWRSYQQSDVIKSSRSLIGSILLGAGSFDLIEGLVNHQILGIHHVKPGVHWFAWDMGFLAAGFLLAATGWLILSRELRHDRPPKKLLAAINPTQV